MTDHQKTHRKMLKWAGALAIAALFCLSLTLVFIYVNNKTDRRLEEIRESYSQRATQRDNAVKLLSARVDSIQKKLDGLPDATARKTAEAVKEDDAK